MQIRDIMLKRMERAEAEGLEAIGYRCLTVGDKLCDMNGNKGVISLVADPEMEPTEAFGIFAVDE